VFAAYLLQAAALSLIGATLGVALGFVVQAILPRVMSAVVPFDVPFIIDWASVGAGVGVGLLVAVLFAIVPLLTIRGIAPLQALRVDYEPARRRVDPYRVAALAILIAAMAGLSVWQADNRIAGLAFAGALSATLLLLWLIAWSLTRITRKLVPRGARFAVRQGIANLYRPHNQTVSVTLSLGFGVFVIATMLAVQANLLGWLKIESGGHPPNVLAFDIQADQVASVRSLLAQYHAADVTLTPIVPARIAALNGKGVDSLAASGALKNIEPWALRREYRNTYRDTMVASEKLVAGRWFNKVQRDSGVIPISMEQDVARDLNLKLGDHVTWDFQGNRIETRIASIRRVDWARFATNFFVVFPTGVLEQAPQTFVAVAHITQASERAAFQRASVAENSNISIIDLATVREALDEIVSKVTLAVRFMAMFSIIAGVIVLIGAIATSRFQRLRESALLKTIGASRRQITEVLVTEYIALGTLAGATGVLLGGVASWSLVKWFFKLEYHVPVVALVVLWLGVACLAVVVGLVNSRDVFRRPPLAVLREISE
jgi:putative ABC transport system permease protein